MARPDPKKWSTDTTQMLVAVLAREDGTPVKPVRAHAQYNPAVDPNGRVSNLFTLASLPEVYTPQSNSRLHLKCANPDCKAKLHYVPEYRYENDFDGNRAHFRSRRVDDHIRTCMFRNPKREHKRDITLDHALDNDLPIFLNIHFDTGFSGKASIGQDYLNEHERWKASIGSGEHAVIAVHSFEELIRIRDKVAMRGEDKTGLLWYGKNTMVLSHEHFWLAPQDAAEKIHARDNRQDPAPYISVLKDILQRAEDSMNAYVQTIHGKTRVIAFEGITGAKIYDASNRLMHAKPVTLRGMSILNQTMEFNFLKIDGYSVAQGKRIVEELLQNGRRFLIAASPSVTFSSNPVVRAKQMRELRAVINAGGVTADSARIFSINWRIDTKAQFISAPHPQREINAHFRSGLPFDEVAPAFTTAAPATVAAVRKDDVVKSPALPQKPEQLKLL